MIEQTWPAEARYQRAKTTPMMTLGAVLNSAQCFAETVFSPRGVLEPLLEKIL